MSNTVCNAVTHTVSNDVCRYVQNQNQNQTVVNAVCGWSVAKKSSIATTEERPRNEKRMGDCVAKIRGVR